MKQKQKKVEKKWAKTVPQLFHSKNFFCVFDPLRCETNRSAVPKLFHFRSAYLFQLTILTAISVWLTANS